MNAGMNLLLWTAAAQEEHLPLVESLKQWGFDGVEFPMFTPDCSPWPVFSNALNDLGLGRTAVTVMPEGQSLCAEDAKARAAGVDHLRQCVDACALLGATVLAGPMHAPVGHLVGRGPTEAELHHVAEGLHAAGAHAADAGIALSVEPLNRFETYVLNAQADAARLTDQIALPNVGILYDTFHANIEEKGLADAIKSSGKRINHVHISANDRATPGEDHIPWTETFAALKAIGYDGWLTIEAFGAWLPEVAGATCIWRKMAPSEEHIAREGLAFIRKSWV